MARARRRFELIGGSRIGSSDTHETPLEDWYTPLGTDSLHEPPCGEAMPCHEQIPSSVLPNPERYEIHLSMRFALRPTAAIALLTITLLLPTMAKAYEQELDKLSSDMAGSITAAKKTTLAVVDFTDLEGNVTALGRFLAEEFSVALASAGHGFRVVDRIHLTTILREHKLSESGLIDPATARQLGKNTGVEALITGSLTPFGDSVRIAVKILDTQTATIIGAVRGHISRTEAISNLMSAGVAGTRGSPAASPSGPLATPPASSIKARQTIESDDFIFALRGCGIANDKVVCDLIVTNQGQDRTLRFYPQSRIFDEFGTEYPPVGAKLGNSKSTLSSSSVGNILISGIPTRAEISFAKIADTSRILAVMEINCSSFKVQFRNVPVAR